MNESPKFSVGDLVWFQGLPCRIAHLVEGPPGHLQYAVQRDSDKAPAPGIYNVTLCEATDLRHRTAPAVGEQN